MVDARHVGKASLGTMSSPATGEMSVERAVAWNPSPFWGDMSSPATGAMSVEGGCIPPAVPHADPPFPPCDPPLPNSGPCGSVIPVPAGLFGGAAVMGGDRAVRRYRWSGQVGQGRFIHCRSQAENRWLQLYCSGYLCPQSDHIFLTTFFYQWFEFDGIKQWILFRGQIGLSAAMLHSDKPFVQVFWTLLE
jgi:hypothetical protein